MRDARSKGVAYCVGGCPADSETTADGEWGEEFWIWDWRFGIGGGGGEQGERAGAPSPTPNPESRSVKPSQT